MKRETVKTARDMARAKIMAWEKEYVIPPLEVPMATSLFSLP